MDEITRVGVDVATQLTSCHGSGLKPTRKTQGRQFVVWPSPRLPALHKLNLNEMQGWGALKPPMVNSCYLSNPVLMAHPYIHA